MRYLLVIVLLPFITAADIEWIAPIAGVALALTLICCIGKDTE